MMLNAFCGSSGQQSALRGLGEHPMPFSKAETALPTMLAWHRSCGVPREGTVITPLSAVCTPHDPELHMIVQYFRWRISDASLRRSLCSLSDKAGIAMKVESIGESTSCAGCESLPSSGVSASQLWAMKPPLPKRSNMYMNRSRALYGKHWNSSYANAEAHSSL
jgi:hypothetical protein